MFVASIHKEEAINLLRRLIETPSFSKEEEATANIIANFFNQKNIAVHRSGNNVWVKSTYWKEEAPIVLLNSHHDTVKPVDSWLLDPFNPSVKDGKLYGLGSNDAGASLISLACTFLQFYQQENLPFNLIFLASAEEEISGRQGVAAVLPQLGKIDFAIVGEPTGMQMAVAEKGLMVIEGTAYGKAGHAARDEGENAIYNALEDINILKRLAFPKRSQWLGDVKVSITKINAGTQHNVVPDHCHFLMDVRTNDCYSNQEAFEFLQGRVKSKLKARSFRLNPSGIPLNHPLVKAAQVMGLSLYGSPTLSDQALMPFPSVKIGPGQSSRSHTADEFIRIDEINNGIDIYCQLIKKLVQHYKNYTHETVEKSHKA